MQLEPKRTGGSGARVTLGGTAGYAGGQKRSKTKTPDSYGVSRGPVIAARRNCGRSASYRTHTCDGVSDKYGVRDAACPISSG